MDFKYSDGGRGESDYPYEKLDCTVRVFALAQNISYDRAHRLFEQAGRKDRHRFSFTKFIKGYADVIRPDILHRQQVKTFLKTNGHKNIIVGIRGHVFCVKNNIILDNCNNMRCIVTDVWVFPESG